MSLMYAFHAKGIGTCPLNWMVEPKLDRKIRALLPLKPSENVIMLMVAGIASDPIRIPKSARQSTDDVVDFL